MALYEIVLESQNPCGGSEYAQVQITEAELDDIQAYVRENTGVSGGITEIYEQSDGSTLVIWDNKGYIKRFTFTEI